MHHFSCKSVYFRFDKNLRKAMYYADIVCVCVVSIMKIMMSMYSY